MNFGIILKNALAHCALAGCIVSSAEASSRGVVINAVGDILLAGSGTKAYERHGYEYSFQKVSSELKTGDLTVGNLEGPLSAAGTEDRQKKYRYRMSTKAASALRGAGFRILTLANNHMMDFGPVALSETLSALDAQGLLYVGAGRNEVAARRMAVAETPGGKVAFLAYSYTFPTSFYAGPVSAGTARASVAAVRADVAVAAKAARHVVVSFHWGREGASAPAPYQRAAARAAIDAGADVVLGHHPHVLQGVEWYGKGIIFYSLGNFTFGTLSTVADRSIIARIFLDEAGVTAAEIVPLNVLNREVAYQPVVLSGPAGNAVAQMMNGRSAGMGSAIRSRGGRYVIDKINRAQAPAVTASLPPAARPGLR